MKKLSLKMKILVPVVILILLGFTVLTAVSMIQFSTTSKSTQELYMRELAYHYAHKAGMEVEQPLNEAYAMAKTMAKAAEENSMEREDVMNLMNQWLDDNPLYFGAYTAWEPDVFDGKDSQYIDAEYHDSTGRFIPYVFRDGNGYGFDALADYETLDYYQIPKRTGKPIVTDPYPYEVAGNEVYLISIVQPVFINGNFAGIVGVDILSDALQSIVDGASLFDTGYVAVLSSGMSIVAHPNKDVLGEMVTDYFAADARASIENALTRGQVLVSENKSVITGEVSKVSFASVEIGKTGTYWSSLVSVPMSELNEKTNQGITTSIILAAIFIVTIITLILIIINIFVSKPMTVSINQIHDASSQVSESSAQLSASSQQLSEGSSEQAASIEETSANMEETSSMVRQNAENTGQASRLSQSAFDAAENGAKKVDDLTDSMEELKKSSNEISRIIKVIDDIAFQTNILALNAAVEAARAGDAGLGFAVVADEVRNLAQKSAKAAKDTTEIIDRNIELSEQGVNMSGEVSGALKDIMDQINNVNQLMAEVADASQEQSKGITQVSDAMSQMELVVQSNAEASEETAASSEALEEQAVNLNDIVRKMNTLINGIRAARDNRDMEVRHVKRQSAARPLPKAKGRQEIVGPDELIPLDSDDEF